MWSQNDSREYCAVVSLKHFRNERLDNCLVDVDLRWVFAEGTVKCECLIMVTLHCYGASRVNHIDAQRTSRFALLIVDGPAFACWTRTSNYTPTQHKDNINDMHVMSNPSRKDIFLWVFEWNNERESSVDFMNRGRYLCSYSETMKTYLLPMPYDYSIWVDLSIWTEYLWYFFKRIFII